MDILPNEIVIRVLLCCSYTDILAFASTCKKYFSLVSNSVNLQLHIELEANGLQVIGGSPNDTNDHSRLLQKLKQYRDAWLDLSFMPPINRECGEETMLCWEFRDGVFAQAFSASGLEIESDSMLIIPLDTDGNISPISFGVAFNEFTLDPSQGLVVLAGVHSQAKSRGWIRICSSVTGQAHSQAKHPLLNLELGFSASTFIRAFDITLEIKGELLAVKFASAEKFIYEILIWNWKTGKLLNRIRCDRGICNFAFLDSDHLVIWSACRESGRLPLTLLNLLVYEQVGSTRFEHDIPDGGTFDIPTFPELSPAFTFHFPKFRAYSQVDSAGFLLRSDYGSRRSFTKSIPFAHSAALTLGLTMSLVLEGTSLRFRIFVDAHQLIDHLRWGGGRQISKLSWHEWGERATRWFEVDSGPNHWICWMFGSRYVISEEYLSVIDFHTPTVRRHANRHQNTYIVHERSEDALKKISRRIGAGRLPIVPGGEDESAENDWPEETDASDDAVVAVCVTSEEATNMPYFDEPVMSRLPYRMVSRVQPVDAWEGWLISGSQLISIDYGFGLDTDEVMVYTVGGLDEINGNS
ncbi:hypothetical protein FRC12_000328 [Ceratobasidium sp. 428]|nr:hypothetical protein FRC12_000328 [Ceratobasidium sp. 428]